MGSYNQIICEATNKNRGIFRRWFSPKVDEEAIKQNAAMRANPEDPDFEEAPDTYQRGVAQQNSYNSKIDNLIKAIQQVVNGTNSNYMKYRDIQRIFSNANWDPRRTDTPSPEFSPYDDTDNEPSWGFVDDNDLWAHANKARVEDLFRDPNYNREYLRRQGRR